MQQVPRQQVPRLPDQRTREMIQDLGKTERKEERIDGFPQPLLTNKLQTRKEVATDRFKDIFRSPIATCVNTNSTVEVRRFKDIATCVNTNSTVEVRRFKDIQGAQ